MACVGWIIAGPFRSWISCFRKFNKFDRPVSKQEAVPDGDLERHIPNLQNLENPLPYEPMKVYEDHRRALGRVGKAYPKPVWVVSVNGRNEA